MRMTNKIMRNNSLYNINQNKMLEDKLTNQMTTQSKIARPSDDPVVAIRALRLRTNVTYVTQYYEKNASDADQWLSMTSDALTTIGDILKDLYEKATSAADKDLTSDDLDIILTQMKSLTQEFYASGNVDYAGRYIFSGYRTDTAITFSAEDIAEMKNHPSSFEITEKFGYEDMDSFYFTDYSTLSGDIDVDDGNGGAGIGGIRDDGTSYEQDITNTKLYRIRLAYDALDSTRIYMAPDGDSPIKVPVMIPAFKDKDGNLIPVDEYPDAETAYRAIASGDYDGVAYIPSTGELVFSEAYYNTNFKEGDRFSVTYDKSEWEEGDINPVHYFECTETRDIGDNKTKEISYNKDGVTTLPQDIYYDVGFNQKIQVNTLASDVFTHNVQRDMDDFQRCIMQLRGIETEISDIEKKMAEYPEDSVEYKNLAQKKAAAEKAHTYIRENIHNQFEDQITKYQNYLDDANVADTNNASRGSRLTLISKRLMNQQATFKDLQTDNESIDVTQAAVELTSSEMIYQAALLATSKIMQTNLMNYI